MLKYNIIFPAIAALALTACGQQANGQAAEKAAEEAVTTAAAIEAPSGEYTTDSGHRYITFSYLHLGYSNPHIRWREWDATLNWNEEDPAASSVTVTIDATSVDSGVDEFDGHLNGEQFFDTANHPEITFVSTSVSRNADANTGKITGDLTIKGTTKPVTLDVVFNKAGYDDRGKTHKIGFSAEGKVNRSEYGLDAYVPYVGDDVTIYIDAEFEKPDEQ